MNLENSRHNLRVLTQAVAGGEQTILKTPSGKFKRDTIFERSIGGGKKLLATIQGSSYALKKTSLENAKTEVQAKLSRQIHYFSGIKNIDSNDKRFLDGTSMKFIEDQMPEKLRENIKIPVDMRARKNQREFEKALNFLISNEICNESNATKIKNQILDEKYFLLKIKNTNEKILPHEIDTDTIDEVSNLAENLIKEHGETMRNAIILARLMQSDELKNEKDSSTRYKIAKNFADGYLFKNMGKMTSEEFSTNLVQVKKDIGNQK